jgi:hypothetical protein
MTMQVHLRKLLLVVALCWVAPASAGDQRSAERACDGSGASATPVAAEQRPLSQVTVLEPARRSLLP